MACHYIRYKQLVVPNDVIGTGHGWSIMLAATTPLCPTHMLVFYSYLKHVIAVTVSSQGELELEYSAAFVAFITQSANCHISN